jgi:hypothetical protein
MIPSSKTVYEVSYRDQSSDYARVLIFTSKKKAFSWARGFVRESYQNAASASVTLAGQPQEPLLRLRNLKGKAVQVF